ncbi:MAG: dynamin family protein [Syntrophobacteraceae bacterium]
MPGIPEPACGPFDETAGAICEYKLLRERVFKSIEGMLEIGLTDRHSCLEFKEKLEANTFNLVVVGQFKRGKTCLINALLGTDLLPVSVVPLTSIVTILGYGDELGVKVFFTDGKVLDIPVESLPEYVTESGNPRNEKDVREVVVLYPSPYLKDGVRLVDTPGVGSVYVHNTDVAYRYLPKSDAALFLLSVDQPASSAELEFLNDVREFADRIFFLLNKTDYLVEDEVERSLSFSRTALEKIMGDGIKIFPVSAKLALSGMMEGSPETVRRSGLPAFSEVLDRFLMKEKGKVLLGSVAKNLLRILAAARLETELELKSLQTPVEEIRDKIKAFQNKKEGLLRERREFDTLFNAELDRLVIRELDRGLGQLKSGLIPAMEDEFNRFYEEQKDLSLKELNDALAGFVREKIEAEFSAWREREDERLSKAFDGICRHFAAQVNQVIDSLLDFSSQLFSVPFEAVEAESLWTSESSFYYKHRDDPVGLDMLTDSLTQVFPKYISGRFERLRAWAYRKANRVILGKRKRHMLEAIEMQSGRLRFDFVDRLDKSARLFRSEMIRNMETISEGITRAIERGMALRSKGEREASELASTLTARVSAMERVRTDLSNIRESAENL